MIIYIYIYIYVYTYVDYAYIHALLSLLYSNCNNDEQNCNIINKTITQINNNNLQAPPLSRGTACCLGRVLSTRKGGWYSWKPSLNSNVSIRVVRTYHLIEIRQTGPCRAIRGNSISVSRSLPPLKQSLSLGRSPTVGRRASHEPLRCPYISLCLFKETIVVPKSLICWQERWS